MTNIYYLKTQIDLLEKSRVNLQKLVLDVNEKAIADAPLQERAELYRHHDMLVDFINFQTNVIDLCVMQIQQMYSKKYVEDLQDLVKKQKFYIKNLGGDPSIISYIKINDLV